MGNITVAFADTHYGYTYSEYSHQHERLQCVADATDVFGGYLRDNRGHIERVVHMGDATESLYPVRGYDPRLAREQSLPLARTFKKLNLPLEQFAGNRDAYYDPKVRAMAREYFHLGVDQDPAETAARHLWHDPGNEIPLRLPGLTSETDGVGGGHGHWTDELGDDPRASALAHDVMTNTLSPKLLSYLRRSEAKHERINSVYELSLWCIARLPARMRRYGDLLLDRIISERQAATFAQHAEKFPGDPRVIIGGHTHAAAVGALDPRRTYLNPGTLTSVARLDTNEPKCTFATITRETSGFLITLFACKNHRVEELARHWQAG